MLLHGEVFAVKLLHLAKQLLHKPFPERHELFRFICQILQLENYLRFQIEYRALKGHLISCGLAFFHAEELKVAAEVKYVELALVLAIDKPPAKAGAAAYHLPELGLAHDLLEEHQIQHLGHVYAGIEHIHGYCDLRQLVRLGKLVDCALGIGHVVIYDFCIARQARVFLTENLQYLLRVAVILGEDDRLSQLFTVVYLQTIRHKQIQRQTYRVLVEQPFVERGGFYALRHLAVFVREGRLIYRFFILREVVISYALGEEFELALHREEVHQIAVLDGLGKLIPVGRRAACELEDLISVLVYLVLGRGGKADDGRVKVRENVAVLVVYRAVRLIANYEVKVSDGEKLALVVLDGVDAVHHRLVGRENTARGAVIPLLAQVGDREVRQQIYKIALRLRDQRIAVCKEKHIFDPVVVAHDLHKRNYRPGLAGAGGHDQQGLASVALAKVAADGLDGLVLIVAPGNVMVYLDILQASAHGAEIEELFQITLGVDGRHAPLGIRPVVDARVEAVSEKDDRPAAALLFKDIRVELGLLAAHGGVDTGALGLDDGQRAQRVVIEHVVGVTQLGLVGHPWQLHLV